jgi:hypothetical protein
LQMCLSIAREVLLWLALPFPVSFSRGDNAGRFLKLGKRFDLVATMVPRPEELFETFDPTTADFAYIRCGQGVTTTRPWPSEWSAVPENVRQRRIPGTLGIKVFKDRPISQMARF